MASLSLKDINKIYDNNVQAVFDFNLEIEDGEFIVFVGPSGCGKSTTLRMVAGLEEISSGQLIIDGNDVTNAAPKNRDIAMVFQSYALYAHMTVYENMAFSLMIRKENEDVIHEKVMAAADVLGLREQLGKKPRQLSGGQMQRVALGRTIVRSPKVFLFDEPLSNLDAKLRGSMRREIKLLHNRLGATMIYVTHDQIEALTLADRIVCMSAGRVQQVGTPTELYDDPANLFVASFIGLPPMNFIDVVIKDKDTLRFDDVDIPLSPEDAHLVKDYIGKEVVLGIRPEDILPYDQLVKQQMGANVSMPLKVDIPVSNPEEAKDYVGNALLSGVEVNDEKILAAGDKGKVKDGMPLTVNINENLGHHTLVHGMLGTKRITAKIKSWCNYKQGDVLEVGFIPGKAHFFDKESTMSLKHLQRRNG